MLSLLTPLLELYTVSDNVMMAADGGNASEAKEMARWDSGRSKGELTWIVIGCDCREY